MSKLTRRPPVESKPLDPAGDPLKWQRLKVRGHGGGRGRMGRLFLRMPLSRAHTILPPSDPAGKMERGVGGRRVDRVNSFHFERSVVELTLSLSSLPLASLDGQELTEGLKSPREDEQLYAAQVRSSKGRGVWLQAR